MPVIAVTESQQVDAAGLLHDVYEITFTISGHPGAFNVTVPKDGNAVAAAQAAIDAEAGQVNAIYAL